MTSNPYTFWHFPLTALCYEKQTKQLTATNGEPPLAYAGKKIDNDAVIQLNVHALQ